MVRAMPVRRVSGFTCARLRQVRRFEEAITAHQDAAAIFQETGDRHREGIAMAPDTPLVR
jgi:hypothetical protein